jgi:hypothetical protein
MPLQRSPLASGLDRFQRGTGQTWLGRSVACEAIAFRHQAMNESRGIDEL